MGLHHQEVHQEPQDHRQQLETQPQHPIPAVICLLKKMLITITIKAKLSKLKKQKSLLETHWLQMGLK
jgi:hypothetical protein